MPIKCELCGLDLYPDSEVCPTCAAAEMQQKIREVVDATIRMLSTSDRMEGQPAKLMFIIGNFYRLSGRFTDAIRYYERAVAHPDARPEYQRCLGTAFAANGEYRSAIDALQRAVEMAPFYPDFHNDLGAAHFKNGQYNEAFENFQEAIRLNPNYANAHNNLGLTYRKLGMLRESELHIRRATEIDPEHTIATYELGLSYYSGGMFSQLRRSALLDARSLGDIYFLREQYEESIKYYERAVQLHPNYADFQCSLAKAYVAVGRKEQALSALEKALKINPQYNEARRIYESLKGV